MFVVRLLGRFPTAGFEEVRVEVIVERCAGLDVRNDTVMACIRSPGTGRKRRQEVRQFRTFTAGLRELRDWLAAEQVTQVALEATGVYWRPVWHVLEELTGVDLLLVNAHHVKKDVSDAVWLAQLCECGLLRGSFVPTPVIAELRDLTRYRKKIIQERTRETQRVQKLLEDAGIKLDSVVSDVLGRSARRSGLPSSAGFNQLAAAAGVPAIGPHQIRHLLASTLLDDGYGIHEVAERLGHDPGTLMRYYTRVSAARGRHATDHLAELLAPTPANGLR